MTHHAIALNGNQMLILIFLTKNDSLILHFNFKNEAVKGYL